MRRFIPSQIEEETKAIKSLSFFDVGVLFVGALLDVFVLASSMVRWLKILLTIVITVIFILSVIKFDMVKGYKLLFYSFKHLIRKKKFPEVNIIKEMGLEFKNDYVKNGEYCIAVIEIDGIDFSILEEATQDAYIAVFANIITEIHNGKIVKLEKPLDLKKYIDYNDALIDGFQERIEENGSDEELAVRIEMLQNQNDYLERFQYFDRIFVEGYYFVIIETNPYSLDANASYAISALTEIGLTPKRLDEKGLRVFTNLYLKNDISDFFQESIKPGDDKPSAPAEEKTVSLEDNPVSSNPAPEETAHSESSEEAPGEVEKKPEEESAASEMATATELPEISTEKNTDGEEPDEAAKTAEIANFEATDAIEKSVSFVEKGNGIYLDGEPMRIICLGEYPYFVGNAWGYELFTIKGTKVVFNFSEYPNKNVAKRISRSMAELNSRLNDKNVREDEKKKILTSYESLDALLTALQLDAEKLLNTELYLIYPKDRHKEIMKLIRGSGIKVNDLLWCQSDGWISTNPFVPMPSENNKERTSAIQSSTVAAMFPFVSKMLYDDEGFYLGMSNRYPIFFNQFTKSRFRVNHNMVVFGKSGGGKSYFMKKLAMRGAMERKKIFILDPDNEYKYLSKSLHGNWIDVGGTTAGRINPLHVFVSMNDEDNKPQGRYEVTSHKQFLEQFFRTILPNINELSRLYLSESITDLYNSFEIRDMTDLFALQPEQYPTFDDLYEIIKKKVAGTLLSPYQKEALEVLELNMKQFVGDGVYARLWNGPTTLNVDNDFTVLNFQSLFANGNTIIANGQMLLLMRFLNQEVVNNNLKNLNGQEKRVEIWIDEAHRYINPTFPVALNFMKTMAKQIRKYSGALIVATQDIADFVGVSEEMRSEASAVIANCQYSMIFGLGANGINDIKDLYKNYNGGLTSQELDLIGHAQQGDALFVVDANIRLPLHIDLYDGEEKYILPQAK